MAGQSPEEDDQYFSIQDLTDEARDLVKEGYAFEGAAMVAIYGSESTGDHRGDRDEGGGGAEGEVETVANAMEILFEDGVTLTVELDSGEKRLRELGYTQDLQRTLSGLELLAIGFNAIGMFVGIVPYYSLAFGSGGPVAVVWFWFITVFFTQMLFASLAEIASSFPTAGSLYFWAAALAPPSYRPFAAWMTGWFEFVGISIGSGALALGSMHLIQILVYVWTGGEPGGGFLLTDAALWGLSTGLLIIAATINLLPIRWLGKFFTASMLIQIGSAIALMVTLLVVAPKKQSASYVFTSYSVDFETTSIPSAEYAVVIGLLLSQYSLYSADMPAHTSEEAKRADVTTPMAMIGSITLVSTLAWCVLVVLTFCIQDPNNLFDETAITGGRQPVIQILCDVFYSRYGNLTGVYVFVFFMWFSIASCTVSLLMGGARVGWALARDKGLPLSNVFDKVTNWKVPVNSLILCSTIAAVCLLPVLGGSTAYFAVTGAATAGWFAAYAIPVLLRLLQRDKDFAPGPFYLNDYVGRIGGKIVHTLALLYALYTMTVFFLPTLFPVDTSNFNYSPIVFAVLLLIIIPWWLIDARHWFEGPLLNSGGAKAGLNAQQVAVSDSGLTKAEIEWFEAEADKGTQEQQQQQ